MNKNTSPNSRSSSGPRSQVRGRVAGKQGSKPGSKSSTQPAQRIARKAGAASRARKKQHPTTTAGRFRRMAVAVGLPNAAWVLAIVVLALGTILLTSSPMAWLPSAIAQGWMISNLAPVEAGDISISALPLLPALILVVLVSSRIHATVKKRASLNDLLACLAMVVAIPTVITVVAWAMLWDAGKVYDLEPPNLLEVLPRMWLLHLTAMAFGLGPRLWKALARRYSLPQWLVDAAITAAKCLIALLCVAFIALVVLFFAGWDNQRILLDEFPNMNGWALAGLIGMSIAYLPNAMIAAMSVLSGSEFHIGDASVSLFSIHLVPLPPMPLAAMVPSAVAPWAVGLMVLTALAIATVMVKVRPNALHALAAAAFSGIFTLLLGYFATGELGAYGQMGPMSFIAAGLIAVWVAGLGLCIAGISALLGRRTAGGEAAVGAAEESTSEESHVVVDGQSVASEETEASAQSAHEAALVDSESDSDIQAIGQPEAEGVPTVGEVSAGEGLGEGLGETTPNAQPDIIDAEVVEDEGDAAGDTANAQPLPDEENESVIDVDHDANNDTIEVVDNIDLPADSDENAGNEAKADETFSANTKLDGHNGENQGTKD